MKHASVDQCNSHHIFDKFGWTQPFVLYLQYHKGRKNTEIKSGHKLDKFDFAPVVHDDNSLGMAIASTDNSKKTSILLKTYDFVGEHRTIIFKRLNHNTFQDYEKVSVLNEGAEATVTRDNNLRNLEGGTSGQTLQSNISDPSKFTDNNFTSCYVDGKVKANNVFNSQDWSKVTENISQTDNIAAHLSRINLNSCEYLSKWNICPSKLWIGQLIPGFGN